MENIRSNVVNILHEVNKMLPDKRQVVVKQLCAVVEKLDTMAHRLDVDFGDLISVFDTQVKEHQITNVIRLKVDASGKSVIELDEPGNNASFRKILPKGTDQTHIDSMNNAKTPVRIAVKRQSSPNTPAISSSISTRGPNVITQSVQPYITASANNARNSFKHTEKQFTAPKMPQVTVISDSDHKFPGVIMQQATAQNSSNVPLMFKLFDQSNESNDDAVVVQLDSSDMNMDTGGYFEDVLESNDQSMEMGQQDESKPEGNHFVVQEENHHEVVPHATGGSQQDTVVNKQQQELPVATPQLHEDTVQLKIEAKDYFEEMKKKRKRYSKRNSLLFHPPGGVAFDDEGNPIHVKREKGASENRTCHLCKKTLANHSNLLVHMRKHTGETPYQCPTCSKTFTVKSNYNRHLQLHAGIKAYECDICERKFAEKKSMQTHRRTHTGEKPYVCSTCGLGFVQLSTLVYHQHIHTGERNHTCDVCGKTFRQSSALHVHGRRHNQQRDIPCHLCAKRFITLKEQMRHLESHEATEEGVKQEEQNKEHVVQEVDPATLAAAVTAADQWTCDKCGQSFARTSELALHKVAVHQELDGKFQKELLESDAELYTMDEDGTLQQVVVQPEEMGGDMSQFQDGVEVLYLDTDESSLTTAGGNEIIVQERDGKMVLVQEEEEEVGMHAVVSNSDSAGDKGKNLDYTDS